MKNDPWVLVNTNTNPKQSIAKTIRSLPLVVVLMYLSSSEPKGVVESKIG
jgi:hypothetical protein